MNCFNAQLCRSFGMISFAARMVWKVLDTLVLIWAFLFACVFLYTEGTVLLETGDMPDLPGIQALLANARMVIQGRQWYSSLLFRRRAA
ncbi:MAG: hypothetical protein IJ228_14195 [Succinivibrio sp.]|nr:hypothetical protein [Succinivibrio sp.]